MPSVLLEIILAVSVVIGAIGAVLFGLGLNVGHPANQTEVYFGVILICIAVFGALIVEAIEKTLRENLTT